MFITGKTYDHTSLESSGLVAVALAHPLALFAAIASSFNISGGHINPAITFGALIGGRIHLIRAIYYWVAQLLGAVGASILLRLATDNMVNSFACIQKCL